MDVRTMQNAPLRYQPALTEWIMANSSRARLVGVALGAFAVACVSCTAPISNDAKLHLAAAPEDFKALGIGKEIEVREDGRRTPQSSDYFEWWYFDGLLDDGTVVVVLFGDNWLYYGSHKRVVNIELTPPGKPTRRIRRTFDDPGAFFERPCKCSDRPS
jgi:hypothetical protein